MTTRQLNGYKTYGFAAGLALVSLYLLVVAGGESTWADPSAGLTGAVEHTIGIVGLMLAGSVASLRHAIAHLERLRR